VPLVHLSDASERRITALLARVLARPEPEARIALLKRAIGLPLRDADRLLFTALLEAMGNAPNEAAPAAQAAFARMIPADVEAMLARLEALVPNRRALVAVLPVLRLTPYSPPHQRAVAEGLLRALARDPRLVPSRIEHAATVASDDELARLFIELARSDLLHADAMAAASSAIASTTDPERVERLLAADDDPRLRRLAVVALATAARPGRGWSTERRERLAAYQRDASPFVAGAAELIFPPDERARK
jgi:hypothetical protein